MTVGSTPSAAAATAIGVPCMSLPDTIIMTRTTDYGVKWSNPTSILGSTPMAPFDQQQRASPAQCDWRFFTGIGMIGGGGFWKSE